MEIKESVPLSEFTTLAVGGTAEYFIAITSQSEVVEAIQFARSRSLPILVLGGGSNILVSDEGFRGVVIYNKLRGISEESQGSRTILKVASGEVWDDLVKYAVERDLHGIECLAGIPGTVGAAPVQNIGAYGQEASETITAVKAIDLETLEISKFSNDQCNFSYRKSLFNTTGKDLYVILEVQFELQREGRPQIAYQGLIDYFKEKPFKSLEDIRKAVIEIRAEKGMVIHQDYEAYKSAGSFYKNPTVPKSLLKTLEAEVGGSDSRWYWEQGDGAVKISAAKLIETVGFHKGDRFGEAGISPKHTLSIINLGNAKAEDIIRLHKKITQGVKERFGIELEPEVQFVGF
jgi:UDP-N-acetylmuramate dehydrogenase